MEFHFRFYVKEFGSKFPFVRISICSRKTCKRFEVFHFGFSVSHWVRTSHVNLVCQPAHHHSGHSCFRCSEQFRRIVANKAFRLFKRRFATSVKTVKLVSSDTAVPLPRHEGPDLLCLGPRPDSEMSKIPVWRGGLCQWFPWSECFQTPWRD